MSELIDSICAAFDGAQDFTSKLEGEYWRSVRDARKNGKKLVIFAGSVPAPMLYAADCVPLCLDMLPLAVFKCGLTAGYISEVEAHVTESLCSVSKIILGTLRAGDIEADAFVRAPVSCPSFKTSYDDALQSMPQLPHFEFDTPGRLTERNIDFMASFMPRFADFLESITGKRPELSELRRLMEQENRSKELLDCCIEARSAKPCPMSSHSVELGRLMPVLGCTCGMEKLLSRELEQCRARTEKSASPCPSGEKHRVFFMQEPLWCGGELRTWLEEQYGAVTVFDGLGYKQGRPYAAMESLEDCYRGLAARLFEPPALCGGTQEARTVIGGAMEDIEKYAPDTLLFLSDRWCRQTWAITKILSDDIQERFGLSMFMTDADVIDPNYKDENQLKTLISEYMEAVIFGK